MSVCCTPLASEQTMVLSVHCAPLQEEAATMEPFRQRVPSATGRGAVSTPLSHST